MGFDSVDREKLNNAFTMPAQHECKPIYCVDKKPSAVVILYFNGERGPD